MANSDYENGVCLKCYTEYEPPEGEVCGSGYFCPVCRDEYKYQLVGVVHFAKKVVEDYSI